MARPREITDERLLTAAGTVIARVGPTFRLADVAAQAEVAVGSVVRRFGSKHGLLVAMSTAAIESLRRSGAVGGGDPVAVLVEWYRPLDDVRTASNNLAQLAVDLADDELRGLLAELYAAMEAQLEPLLSEAITAGELPGAPPASVAARIMTAIADGTAVHWSARPVGGMCDRMRTDLEAVLAGWRA
jgi:AcrR family transcriptional regulator